MCSSVRSVLCRWRPIHPEDEGEALYKVCAIWQSAIILLSFLEGFKYQEMMLSDEIHLLIDRFDTACPNSTLNSENFPPSVLWWESHPWWCQWTWDEESIISMWFRAIRLTIRSIRPYDQIETSAKRALSCWTSSRIVCFESFWRDAVLSIGFNSSKIRDRGHDISCPPASVCSGCRRYVVPSLLGCQAGRRRSLQKRRLLDLFPFQFLAECLLMRLSIDMSINNLGTYGTTEQYDTMLLGLQCFKAAVTLLLRRIRVH